MGSIKGKRILLVDDEIDLLEVLQIHLQLLGADVSTSRSGDEAFAVLQEQQFDLVISDVRMPGGDGPSLLRRLRSSKNLPQPVFLLMTGFTDAPIDAKAEGAQEIIQKPFAFQDLGTLLSKYFT